MRRQSSQPSADGVTGRTWSRCVQVSGMADLLVAPTLAPAGRNRADPGRHRRRLAGHLAVHGADRPGRRDVHGGRGVGRALGEHVVAAAREDGYRSMQFNAVVETNTRAVALWRSLGFDVLATVPEAFDHPEHGLVGLHVMFRRL
jgi:ribosomal protein S18 acetylase RimI-like enzyme